MSDPEKIAGDDAAPEQAQAAETRKSPPKVYIPSCGVLCDVFWWARRREDEPAPGK